MRYNRTKRGSDKSGEDLYRETSGRGATRDNEINISSTFKHSIRRLDAQANDTLPLDDSFGKLGDDRRHPSQRASRRGEARGANDSSIQAGVLGEGYSLRGRSEEIKRDGQYRSGNLQDNGGTIDLQGISQSERREISDERDKRKTARALKGENVEENFTLDENTLPLWLKQDLKKFLDCKNSNVHPNFDLSLYWSELYTTINISQLSKEITKDEADYLRRKYLGIC